MRPALNAGGDYFDGSILITRLLSLLLMYAIKCWCCFVYISFSKSALLAENWCAEPSETEPLDQVIGSVSDYMSTEHEDMTMFALSLLAISHPAKRLDYVTGHEEPVLQALENNNP